MALNSYCLCVAAIFFILMRVSSSMVVREQYVPLIDIGQNEIEDQVPYINQAYLQQRLDQPNIPAVTFTNWLKKSDADQGLYAIKRESFGRKHHWDAFFG